MGPYPRVKGVSCVYSCLCPWIWRHTGTSGFCGEDPAGHFTAMSYHPQQVTSLCLSFLCCNMARILCSQNSYWLLHAKCAELHRVPIPCDSNASFQRWWVRREIQSEFIHVFEVFHFSAMSLKQDSLICAPAALSQIYHSYYHSLNTLSFLLWLLLCYLERSYWNSSKDKLEDYCYIVILRLSLTHSLWNWIVSWVLV